MDIRQHVKSRTVTLAIESVTRCAMIVEVLFAARRMFLAIRMVDVGRFSAHYRHLMDVLTTRQSNQSLIDLT
jgi:hypothetical protein